MEDCIFCKIMNGEIPSAKVYEDEEVYAFLDLGQVTKGHTLIVPKKHARNVFDLDADAAASLFYRVPKIANALKAAFPLEGLNVLNNNEEIASQSVFHFHVHLIPRYNKQDGFGLKWQDHSSSYTPESFNKIAADIRDHLK
ncbi:HIT family protein [Listeria sp. PSOL-1]|uniref:HIT family protein n=1 Tax=Listeria sp. PSOL-1 TaxID=1844999 RepID=UPI0013D7B32B|nr:HIT family protein [Listeria sp. PSOL-1]